MGSLIAKALSALSLGLAALVAAGCGTKDTDPQQKIDTPGYYNGPREQPKKQPGGPAGGKTMNSANGAD